MQVLRKLGAIGTNLAGAAGVLLMSTAPAHAVFALPTEITDAQANVAIVGAGVFAVYVGVKLYKWLKSAL